MISNLSLFTFDGSKLIQYKFKNIVSNIKMKVFEYHLSATFPKILHDLSGLNWANIDNTVIDPTIPNDSLSHPSVL